MRSPKGESVVEQQEIYDHLSGRIAIILPPGQTINATTAGSYATGTAPTDSTPLPDAEFFLSELRERLAEVLPLACCRLYTPDD